MHFICVTSISISWLGSVNMESLGIGQSEFREHSQSIWVVAGHKVMIVIVN